MTLKLNIFIFILLLISFSPTLVSTSLSNTYVFPILVVVSLVIIFGFRASKRFKQVPVVFVLIFIVVPIPSIINSINLQDHGLFSVFFEYFRFASLGVVFLGCYLSASKVSEKGIKNTIGFIILLNLILIVTGIYFTAVNEQLFYLYYNHSDLEVFYGYMLSRPSGTFGNPNTLAMSLVFLSSIFLSTKMSKLDLFFLGLVIVLLIITKSRSGMLGMIFLLIVYYALKGKLGVSIRYIMLISVILCAAFFMGLVDQDEFLNRYFFEVNLAGRDVLWADIFLDNLVVDNFFLGLGVVPESITMVDNEYINLFIKYGFFGLAIFFIFFILIITVFIKMYLNDNRNDFVIKSISILLLFLLFSLASSPLSTIKLSYIFLLVFSFYSNKISAGYKCEF